MKTTVAVPFLFIFLGFVNHPSPYFFFLPSHPSISIHVDILIDIATD
jgi:hypothetical protein